MLRFPHFLDNRFADGGKVVSPTCQEAELEAEEIKIFVIFIIEKLQKRGCYLSDVC
jgi:hypothetical protein